MPGHTAILGAVDAQRLGSPISSENPRERDEPALGGAGEDETRTPELHRLDARADGRALTGSRDDGPGCAAIERAKKVEASDRVGLIAPHDPLDGYPPKPGREEKQVNDFIARRADEGLLPVLATISGAPDGERSHRRF